jgi:hypothetical protein
VNLWRDPSAPGLVGQGEGAGARHHCDLRIRRVAKVVRELRDRWTRDPVAPGDRRSIRATTDYMLSRWRSLRPFST